MSTSPASTITVTKIGKLSRPRFLCLGDVIDDVWQLVEPDGKTQEDDSVDRFKVREHFTTVGGVGIVWLALAAELDSREEGARREHAVLLGGKSIVPLTVYEEMSGAVLLDLRDRALSGYPALDIKRRSFLVDQGQLVYLGRADLEGAFVHDEALRQAVMQATRDLLEDAYPDLSVSISAYDKGFVNKAVVYRLLGQLRARTSETWLVHDGKQEETRMLVMRDSAANTPVLAKCNQTEAARMMQLPESALQPCDLPAETFSAMQAWLNRAWPVTPVSPRRFLLITRGERPAILCICGTVEEAGQAGWTCRSYATALPNLRETAGLSPCGIVGAGDLTTAACLWFRSRFLSLQAPQWEGYSQLLHDIHVWTGKRMLERDTYIRSALLGGI